MSGDARQVPAPGPAPVSVHDDSDVPGKSRRIKPQVNVLFFAVQSCRNLVSQVELSESKLPHEILRVQCEEAQRVDYGRTYDFHYGETLVVPGLFYLASSGNIVSVNLSVWRMAVSVQRTPA